MATEPHVDVANEIGNAVTAEGPLVMLERYDEWFSPDEITSAEGIDSERVLVQAKVKGTGTGSGIPIDRDVAYVWEIRDGLTTSGRSFFSLAEAKEFLASV